MSVTPASIGVIIGYATAGWLLARVAAEGRVGGLFLGLIAGVAAAIGREPGLLLLTALASVAASRWMGSGTVAADEAATLTVQLARWAPGLALIGVAPLTASPAGVELAGVAATVAATATLGAIEGDRARYRLPGLGRNAVPSAGGISSAALARALCAALLVTAAALGLELLGPGDPALMAIAAVVALTVQERSRALSLPAIPVVLLSLGAAAVVGGALAWLLP